MQTQNKSQTISSLTYRGVSYSKMSLTMETVPTQTPVRYRGATYFLQRPMELSLAPQQNLKYRGVSYRRHENPAINLDHPAIPCPA
ncbi:MAG: DUF4278 domain-containing protein [Halothece sp. Uz-M2-17]|nr:DUF4278 domain-containing protein [Halothece sp. Uz-M2-17]